jgi:hypothetical protein
MGVPYCYATHEYKPTSNLLLDWITMHTQHMCTMSSHPSPSSLSWSASHFMRRRRHPPLLLKSCSMKLIKTTNKLNQGMELNNIEIFYIHGTPIRPWPYAWHNTSRWLTPTQLWILLLYQKNMGIVGNTCKEELDWQSWNNWSHYPHASTDVSLLQGYMKKEKLRARDFSPKLDKSANEIQFQGRKIHFF